MAKKQTNKKTTKAKKPAARNHWFYIKIFWIVFASGLGLVILIFLLAGWGAFGKMPSFEELENPEKNIATQIISSDSKILGTFYNENRTPVKYEELPPHLVQALVATEDERYYDHSGIDARGTIRALAYLGKKGGASTITQQLAKLLFHGERARGWKRYMQKIKEWVIAARLERQYTKEEIVTMYLNKQDFLYHAIGIGSAARIYFGKNVKDLNVEEGAVFVAMLKNPRIYNPKTERFRENSKNRRNQVLKQMEKNGFLSTVVKDSLQQLPLKINFSPEGHSDGIATYFREYLRDFMKSWIKENPRGKDSEGEDEFYNIYRDGLRINVTIDSRMQRHAEKAVHDHLSNLQGVFDKKNKKNKISPFRDVTKSEVRKIYKDAMRRSDRFKILTANGMSEEDAFATFDEKTDMRIFTWQGEKDTIMTPRDSIRYYKSFLQTGMMSMEPQTGHVKAWVGGINYKHFQYDHVKQGKRQIGSTFKPFVYATAIDQLKLSPCDTLPNTPYTIEAGRFGSEKDWTPRNSGGKYGGMLNLKQALAGSVNTITARLMGKIGPGPVANLARKMGVTSRIPEVPAIALGTPDLSVYEMVGAYSTFANEGIYTPPILITSIEDKNGTVLYQSTPDPQDVISKEAAFVTINLMEGVTQYGSGARLRSGANNREDYKIAVTGHPYNFKNAIAGKTGTTQNNSDGWFMGIVPNLCTGVWVGAEDRAAHFESITYGQGATMALPIWALYMKSCYADKELDVSKDSFKPPAGLSIRVDCTTASTEDSDEEEGTPKDEPENTDEFDL